jgi:hypothetical protein
MCVGVNVFDVLFPLSEDFTCLKKKISDISRFLDDSFFYSLLYIIKYVLSSKSHMHFKDRLKSNVK